MIEPKVITITLANGTDKDYTISKFPALAGREIVTQYPISATPKIGDYKTNEELCVKLMAYVAVVSDTGAVTKLSTRSLIDNHVPEFETLMKLEFAVMEYNCSFFGNGQALSFLAGLGGKAEALIAKILTGLLPPSSAKD